MKYFFNIVYIVVISLCLTQSAFAKNIRFAQITDLHFTENESSIENFNDLINAVNKLDKLDYVFFTGDNIDVANSKDLEAFLKMCKKIKTPYYIQIGNHDCVRYQNLSKQQYANFIKKYSHQKFSKFNYVIKDGDVVFVFADGAKEIIPFSNGYFKKDDLTWLDKQLKKYKNKKVIILQHFPVIDAYPNSGHNLYKSQDYKDVLAKHNNVKAIFAGHYHSAKEENINGVLHIVTPAAKKSVRNFRYVKLNDSKHGLIIDSSILDF